MEQYFKILDQGNRIGECRVDEIPQKTKERLGDDIEKMTFFYDKINDFIILNRDYELKNEYYEIIKTFLSLSENSQMKAIKNIPEDLRNVMIILKAIDKKRKEVN